MSPPGPPPNDCEDAHESQDEAAEADGVTSLHAGLEGRGISGSVADLENIVRPSLCTSFFGQPPPCFSADIIYLSSLQRPSSMRIVAAVVSNINFEQKALEPFVSPVKKTSFKTKVPRG